MLNIQNLTKKYDDKIAVNNLTLSIEPGELCAFIGQNGAGKTTTIKCCCGILPFDAGNITVGGISVKDDPIAVKRQIAYIPDNPDLYEFLSGIKYLNLIADIYGIDREARGRDIEKYASLFGIDKNLTQPVASYSHGMKQKLAVTAALIHHPKLMLLDEPFVGLDPKAAHILKEIMHEICDAGGSIFFSTHVLEVAEKLCDKVAIIKGGELLVSGDMDTVRGNDSLEQLFLELAD